METAIVWGWILTMQITGMPVIIDVNYDNEAQCETVKSELAPLYPNHSIACTPTWKPEAAKKVAKKKPSRRKTTYRRTARR